MSNDKYLPYRGTLKAIGSRSNHVFFITGHEEKLNTPLYQFDLETFKLTELGLSSPATALLVTPDYVWVAGNTGIVYRDNEPLTQLHHKQPIHALASLQNDRLALRLNDSIEIINTQSGQLLQTVKLPETVTAMASDNTGAWLAVGTGKGSVFVYENEDDDSSEFSLSESAKLHEGAVSALLFDTDELRFLSTGNDNQLLLTHARGKLEPEDRGRGAGHSAAISAMLQTGSGRFITGSQDKSCKSWLCHGGTRPATLADNAGAVVDMTIASLHDRAQLVIASKDYIRIVALDAAGKFDQLSYRLYDAYAEAKNALTSNKQALRIKVVQQLAGYNDQKSLQLLNLQMKQEPDFGIRKQIAESMVLSDHKSAQGYLEAYLNHNDEAVRVLVFTSLQQRVPSENALRPLDLALKTGYSDIGKLAVSALQQLAGDDDRAMMRLIGALDVDPYAVRIAALSSLECLDPAEANIIAVASKQADIRRAALIRMYQRGTLDQPRVLSTLRRRLDDSSAEVRQTAMLVSLFSRPRLLRAIRERDKDLHRLLFDIESFSLEPDGKDKPKVKEPSIRKTKLTVKPDDYTPLIQAAASLSVDTSLLGAHCLAVLNDPRALGLLLQLSREPHNATRVKVCQALAALNDKRADQRLLSLLNDRAMEVRDAAYTALTVIHQKTPQNAAQLGLNAEYPDVRRRALQHLVKMAKQSPPQSNDTVWDLLLRSLNDSDRGVRAETFKAVLNLPIGGTQETALRFALQGIHDTIRREVQTELFAESRHPWAWSMLLELLSDADKTIRCETLQFALKKTKGRDFTPLEFALKSPYRDTRLQAVSELIKKPSHQAQALLITAINDSDRDVRNSVIGALVDSKAKEALQLALQSEYDDVVIMAANACAGFGDRQALGPLTELIGLPHPDNADDRKRWQVNVESALDGLALLAMPECVADITPLLQHQTSRIRIKAAHTLMWCSDSSHRTLLTAALQHQDKRVKFYAAVGLSFLGDEMGMQVALEHCQDRDDKLLCIGALLSFDTQLSDRLSFYLDDSDRLVHIATLLSLLLLEYKKPQAGPTHLLSILSAQSPQFRLIAAEALENFDDHNEFTRLVSELFNEQQNAECWNISPETINSFAEIMVSAAPKLRCRTLPLLQYLFELKQDAWDHAWDTYAVRYEPEIHALVSAGKQRERVAAQIDHYELQMMAFGTYCGLVREQGDSNNSSCNNNIIFLRQSALRRLGLLCQRNNEFIPMVVQVFIQALGDANQPVRLYALELLQLFRVDRSRLSAECLETGHHDLGIAALEMLTEGESLKKGQVILEQAMLTRSDDLALEAAKLLLKNVAMLKVAKQALDAISSEVRQRAVDWLIEDYDNSKARTLLYSALTSRHAQTREYCAEALVVKKDIKALPHLVTLLNGARNRRGQWRFIQQLVHLGDLRGANALLDRIENDADQNADIEALFGAVGGFRDISLAPRLLSMLSNKKWSKYVYKALVAISGYDQYIDESKGQDVEQRWLEEQYPRHDGLLQEILTACLELGENNFILNLLDGARWSPSAAVNDIMNTLTKHRLESIHRNAVYAVGWRARKRHGPIDALLTALQHKDAETQFLAAESLALLGNAQGISILLAGIDTLADLNMRKRAVIALGELGDGRALDSVLRLASDNEHALQVSAAEAIGHLGNTDKHDQIFALLKGFINSDSYGIQAFALRGLRHFNSQAGWQLVRDIAADANVYYRDVALEILGYNDDPATRDLLLQVLAEKYACDEPWCLLAINSARRLFGSDALQPDYALLRSGGDLDGSSDQLSYALERVCGTGDAGQVFSLLPDCSETVFNQLSMSLLKQQPLPVDEAVQALTSPFCAVVDMSATVLGYSSQQGKTVKAVKSAVQTALAAWMDKWTLITAKVNKGDACDVENMAISHTLQRLIWACGKLQCATDALPELACRQYDNRYANDVRFASFNALSLVINNKGTDQQLLIDLFRDAITDSDQRIRTLAAHTLGDFNGAVDIAPLAQRVSSDRKIYQALTTQFDAQKLNAGGLSNVHLQAVVLPQVIKSHDVDALVETAIDNNLSEETQQVAINALAQLGSQAGEQALVGIAKNESLDEDLRKMAWRCLRRSKRSRAKQNKRQVG